MLVQVQATVDTPLDLRNQTTSLQLPPLHPNTVASCLDRSGRRVYKRAQRGESRYAHGCRNSGASALLFSADRSEGCWLLPELRGGPMKGLVRFRLLVGLAILVGMLALWADAARGLTS